MSDLLELANYTLNKKTAINSGFYCLIDRHAIHKLSFSISEIQKLSDSYDT